MKIYTVHLRHSGLDPDRDIVLVKEGFSVPAFLFGSLWAVAKGLWLPVLILLAISLGALLATAGLGDAAGLIVDVGIAIIIGYTANDLWRWALDRRGFVEMGVVMGPDPESAWSRFVDTHPGLLPDRLR
jgi:hypothetical protein